MKYIVAIFFIIGLQSFAQNLETKILKPDHKDFVDISKNYNFEGVTKYLINAKVKGHGNYSWFFNEKSYKNGSLDSSYGQSVNSVYAYLMIEDHGGYLQKSKFQDFANEVYLPYFIYEYCLIDDADKDGIPEFYLTYFGMSDGLDSKPLKVIVYTKNDEGNDFLKSKITEFYPVDEGVDFRTEFDINFKQLPKSVQKRATKILSDIKKKDVLKWK